MSRPGRHRLIDQALSAGQLTRPFPHDARNTPHPAVTLISPSACSGASALRIVVTLT